MSIQRPPQIPQRLNQELEKEVPRLNAVPLISIDSEGMPHVALLSYLEIFARGIQLCFFLYSGSSSAKNLQVRSSSTLAFIQSDFVFYLKGHSHYLGEQFGCSVFDFQIRGVLEDQPLPQELDVALSSGIRFISSDDGVKKRLILLEQVRGWRESQVSDYE